MRRTAICAALATLALLAACASDKVAMQPVTYTVVKADDRIPSASTVRNFRVGEDNPRSVLLEGNSGRWYRLSLDNYCARALPWREAIGIVSDASNTIDKFSTLLIDGQRCFVRSIDQIKDPDAKPPAPPVQTP